MKDVNEIKAFLKQDKDSELLVAVDKMSLLAALHKYHLYCEELLWDNNRLRDELKKTKEKAKETHDLQEGYLRVYAEWLEKFREVVSIADEQGL